MQNNPGPISDVERLALQPSEIFPGKLVWARLPNSIWWPSIVIKIENGVSRVSYMDYDAAVEGWVPTSQLLHYTGEEFCIDGETCSDGVDWSEQLHYVKNEVMRNLCITVKGPRNKFTDSFHPKFYFKPETEAEAKQVHTEIKRVQRVELQWPKDREPLHLSPAAPTAPVTPDQLADRAATL